VSVQSFDLGPSIVSGTSPQSQVAAHLNRTMAVLNRAIVIASSLALILASGILSYSVAMRYFFNAATYWQDEAAVFLLVGATFMSSAFVQSIRGHIGIEAFTSHLSPRADAIRMLLVDFASFVFCAFFAWKSWTLLHEAWVDGQVTGSTWAPPLWIPYSTMAIGMTLLTLQIALQLLAAIDARTAR
jgi:TRAP-type C4-dicarboxylate transport system permease small subunit